MSMIAALVAAACLRSSAGLPAPLVSIRDDRPKQHLLELDAAPPRSREAEGGSVAVAAVRPRQTSQLMKLERRDADVSITLAETGLTKLAAQLTHTLLEDIRNTVEGSRVTDTPPLSVMGFDVQIHQVSLHDIGIADVRFEAVEPSGLRLVVSFNSDASFTLAVRPPTNYAWDWSCWCWRQRAAAHTTATTQKTSSGSFEMGLSLEQRNGMMRLARGRSRLAFTECLFSGDYGWVLNMGKGIICPAIEEMVSGMFGVALSGALETANSFGSSVQQTLNVGNGEHLPWINPEFTGVVSKAGVGVDMLFNLNLNRDSQSCKPPMPKVPVMGAPRAGRVMHAVIPIKTVNCIFSNEYDNRYFVHMKTWDHSFVMRVLEAAHVIPPDTAISATAMSPPRCHDIGQVTFTCALHFHMMGLEGKRENSIFVIEASTEVEFILDDSMSISMGECTAKLKPFGGISDRLLADAYDLEGTSSAKGMHDLGCRMSLLMVEKAVSSLASVVPSLETLGFQSTSVSLEDGFLYIDADFNVPSSV